jgi:hypothetical protein
VLHLREFRNLRGPETGRDLRLQARRRSKSEEILGLALFGNSVRFSSGIDAIPPSPSQEKKWSDEIRKELLPAWLRDHAHPIIQAGLERMKNVSSRATEDCIFIDYEPVAPALGYALPSVKLEFGARSSGEPSTIIPVLCDMEGLVSGVAFPTAEPRVMNLTRIFWEKATAAHVYCVQGEKGLSNRFSRHFHDLVRLEETGHLPEALEAKTLPKRLPFTRTHSSLRRTPAATESTIWRPFTAA